MKRASFIAMLAFLCVPGHAEEQKAQPKEKDPNQVVCRRQEVTGSLVRSTKVCRTRADWERARDDAQKEGERLLTRTVSVPNG
jgi:hypothetical protein